MTDDTSTVALVKYGRGGKGKETETALLTADNLSLYKDGKGVVLSLHHYDNVGNATQSYRLRLCEGDTVRLRSLLG